LSQPAIRSTVIEIIGLVLLETARRKLVSDQTEV